MRGARWQGRRAWTRLVARLALVVCLAPALGEAQAPRDPVEATPLRQGTQTGDASTALSLRDAARDDRWLGLAPRDVRWAPDGSGVYFRWHPQPSSDDLADADPWYRADRDGRSARQLTDPDALRHLPGEHIAWSPGGEAAAWASGATLYAWDGRATRATVSLDDDLQRVRFHAPGVVHFEAGEALYEYRLAAGTLAVVATRTHRDIPPSTTAADWLAAQQRDLFQHVRRQQSRDAAATLAERALATTQHIPLPRPLRIDHLALSPDRRFLTFRATTPAEDRPPTQYIDYAHASGYATVLEARSKTGETRDIVRLGIIPVDPAAPDDAVSIAWVQLPEAGDRNTVPHGPYWSTDGRRALLQFISEDHRDLWFAELDVERGSTRVITQDHDDAWIGGPPVQANYLGPALLEWLPDGRWVFASERSGWSHLYIVDADDGIAPLTSGAWEVRGAALTRARDAWLLQASRKHPADDHLYCLPAGGGELERLTTEPGRHAGWLSPDGQRLARLHGTATDLPDLFIDTPTASAQVTDSGTAHLRALDLAEPEIVSFTHPDGDPIWAALYTPAQPHPQRPAVIHVHGGGYRQFAHRGWSVYGWALHVGFVNYLVQHGYTVLDFDYRGSAGFGRDYRTDIARSMGQKDTDGVAAAAAWLVRERGIAPDRIGMHGVSYGGFLTLMTLFRYPGTIAAGIARASVTDWAHYSDGWTSRILGVPHEDPESYRRSSPIYYAEGLADPLLLTHGILDDNVHFQDAVRLVQKLIELEKDFEVMYYPIEPHTIATEPARYDFLRRAAGFFEKHLLAERP